MSIVSSKRGAVSVKELKRRAAAGEDISNQRALMRVGRGTTRLLTGQEDLSTWDDEELARGQKRGKNGRFNSMPHVIPKYVHDELVRRTLSKAEELMRENLYAAIEALIDIIKGSDTEDKDRIRAIEIIMNRVMGKEPVKVELAAMKTRFEEALDAMLVPTDKDEEDVIDVESWDNDAG